MKRELRERAGRLRGARTAAVVALAATGFPLLMSNSAARANDGSTTPFIDQLRREMPPSHETPATADNPTPFIDSIKQKAGPEKEEGSFIDKVMGENPGFFRKNDDGSYTDRKKAELGPAQEGGAIQAVAEGHSELHARKVGEPNAAFGMQMTYLINPDFTATSGAQPFNNIYRTFTPDIALTYNRRLFRFWSGEIGLDLNFGGTFNRGQGIFKYQLSNYNLSGNPQFSRQSGTHFQFISVPLSAGLNYRMAGLKYIQPFVSILPTLVPYVETRDDNGPTHYGDSRAIISQVGVWLQLDWISKSAEWDLYKDYGVLHYNLAVLYQNETTLSGGVDFSFSGVTVGFVFEY